MPSHQKNQVSHGPWTGHTQERGESFYGIRYARLSNPHNPRSASIPAQGQLQVTDLTEVPIFPQLPSRLEAATGPGARLNPQDDEAFFLNVWTPETTSSAPVVVFIHGGAWASGGGSVRWYRGEQLAAEGNVVVTLNYRLGPAGHLDTEEEHAPFQDLLLALRWVQTHIAEFGGDPTRVTLAGQSAGGWYTWALSAMDEARGLFQQAAILSAPEIQPWTPEYRRYFTQAAQEIKSSAHDSMEWLEAAAAVLAATPRIPGAMPPMYLPSLGPQLQQRLSSAHAAAEHLHIQALYIRVTHHEMSLFLPWDLDSHAVEQRLQALRTRTQGHQLPGYPSPPQWDPVVAETVELSSWLEFGHFAHQIAATGRDHGLPVEFREFGEIAGPAVMGAAHCFDIPFQFGNWDDWADSPLLEGWTHEDFEDISLSLRRDLTTFIHRAGLSSSPLPSPSVSVCS